MGSVAPLLFPPLQGPARPGPSFERTIAGIAWVRSRHRYVLQNQPGFYNLLSFPPNRLRTANALLLFLKHTYILTLKPGLARATLRLRSGSRYIPTISIDYRIGKSRLRRDA